jgi:molybdopterin-biosynthesis enzyme MoeA-like protein
VIVCLPGVPAELKSIVSGPLSELLDELFGAHCYCERAVVVNCDDEATLAPLLSAVTPAHPAVYIKSRAVPFGSRVRLRITLSIAGSDRQEAETKLQAALKDLREGLDAIAIPFEAEEA